MLRTSLLLWLIFGSVLVVPIAVIAQRSREHSYQSEEPTTVEQPNLDLRPVERRIIAATNDFRKQNQLREVRENHQLNAAAREFANFLARTVLLSHEADGREPWDRAAQHGYEYCIVLENIAMQGFSVDRLADGFVQQWKESPRHRKNMLDRDVSETGVGVAHSTSSGHYYAVQMFGRPRSEEIVFHVSNRESVPVQFTIDGQEQTLEPRSTGSYTRCRPPKVELSNGQVAWPEPGATYFIEKDRDGQERISLE
jgi:uncharacterized protein YkwD